MVIPVNPRPVRAARLDCQMRVEDQGTLPSSPSLLPTGCCYCCERLGGGMVPPPPLHTPPLPPLHGGETDSADTLGPLTPN